MDFVWFWTFWHWSRESFRIGRLLRGPLSGIAGHWDEWYRHEASRGDRDAIEETGRTERGQREFIAWLCRHWARETAWRESRVVPRFVLHQLAQVPPFDGWSALETHRAGYGARGIHAIVLREGSGGEPGDVRAVEAVALPLDSGGADVPVVVPEGFVAGEAELDTARRAALRLLCGKGLAAFLALWVAAGRRPSPQWARVALGLGWFAVAALILYLLAGPEPEDGLVPLSIALATLWSGLVATAVAAAGTQSLRAWRQGRSLRARLEASQVRLRMDVGLTLKGGSAGLAFCLNLLAAAYRAHPRRGPRSWLWQRLFRRMRRESASWAATGVVTPDCRIRPVVLEPKLRACLQDARIRHVLAPRQRGSGRWAVDRLSDSLAPAREDAPGASLLRSPRLGFAAERRRLRCHRASHLAQSLMSAGGFTSVPQMALNAFAAAASVVVIAALPDLQWILLPPPAPAVVAPSSPSPYHLWVSLDTKHPDRFLVVLESGFWSNRRSEVTFQRGSSPSARAEIHLRRLARQTADDEEDGTVWIERRRWFLGREFAPGERVGRYSFSYVSRLGHE